jgi:hypothetical protein
MGGALVASGFQSKPVSGLEKSTVVPGWKRSHCRAGAQVRPPSEVT